MDLLFSSLRQFPLPRQAREKVLLSEGNFKPGLPVCRFGVWEGALTVLLQYMVRVEWVLLQECSAARRIMWATQTRGTPLKTLTRRLRMLTECSFWAIWWQIRGPPENVLELGIGRRHRSWVKVKGSFIPTVCKEMVTLACWSKVSDLSLSDGTDLIMQCLLRTAPLCLLFLLVCPLGSQHSLQCLRLADQHAHLSDRSAGNSSELQQCWQGFFFF